MTGDVIQHDDESTPGHTLHRPKQDEDEGSKYAASFSSSFGHASGSSMSSLASVGGEGLFNKVSIFLFPSPFSALQWRKN